MNIESKLEDTLSRLMTECRKLAYTQPSNVDMLPVLTLFLKLLGRSSDTQLYYFKEKFQGELQRMKPIIAKYEMRTSRSNIHKHPRQLYYNLHEQLQVADSLEVVHYIERVMQLIF